MLTASVHKKDPPLEIILKRLFLWAGFVLFRNLIINNRFLIDTKKPDIIRRTIVE